MKGLPSWILVLKERLQPALRRTDQLRKTVSIVTDGTPQTSWGTAALATFRSVQQVAGSTGQQTSSSPFISEHEATIAWCLLIISNTQLGDEPQRHHEIENALRSRSLPTPLAIQFCRPSSNDTLPAASDPVMIGRLATRAEAATLTSPTSPFQEVGR